MADPDFKRLGAMIEVAATAWRFWEKHALGPKLAPSCFVCGETVSFAPAVQHAELPGIVCCSRCKVASDQAKQPHREVHGK